MRPAQHDKVVVRRLKSDLLALSTAEFPRRHVVRVDPHQEAGGRVAESFDPLAEMERRELGPADAFRDRAS